MKTAVLIVEKDILNSRRFSGFGRCFKEFLNDSSVIDFGNVKRIFLVFKVTLQFFKKVFSKFHKELLRKVYCKKTLMFSKVFVSYYLEPTIEIGLGSFEIFFNKGNEKVQLVLTLSNNYFWKPRFKGIMDKIIIK
tara:strand:+ start:233 stop:637 length:405 start_codon:yes stop_codon:yes gene_type:complete